MEELISKLISSLIGWGTILVVAWAVVHSLKVVFQFVSGNRDKKIDIIPVIELVMLLILGVVVLHQYLHPHDSAPSDHDSIIYAPVFLVVLMIIFTMLSIMLYLLHQAIQSLIKRRRSKDE